MKVDGRVCATGEAGGKKYGGMKEEAVAGRAKGACHEEEELQYSTYDSKGKITVSVLTKKYMTLTTNKPNTLCVWLLILCFR